MVGNSRFQKKANRALILNYLYLNKTSSRRDMAQKLGLQPSTVTYIIDQLIREGVVHRIPKDRREENPPKGSGRKPIELEICPRFGRVIGLDLQADYYVVAVYDMTGNLIHTEKKEYKTGTSDFKERLEDTVDRIKNILDPTIPILGMGLALPGIIDRGQKRIIDCWTHNLREVDLSQWLINTFNFPVIMENDANCAALYLLSHMKTDKVKEEEQSFIYLLPRFHNPSLIPEKQPSVGIGMGLVFHGSLFRGVSHEAGEYQSILSSRAGYISRQISLSDDKMNRAYKDEAIQKEITGELMDSMKLILQILNPQSLQIGGDLSGKENFINDVVHGLSICKWETLTNKGCHIAIRKEGNCDPAAGAGTLIFEQLYAIPQIGKAKENNSLEIIGENYK